LSEKDKISPELLAKIKRQVRKEVLEELEKRLLRRLSEEA